MIQNLFFVHLEPEQVEKKYQEPEPLGEKNQEPETEPEPLEKSQEPEPEPLENLTAPSPESRRADLGSFKGKV